MLFDKGGILAQNQLPPERKIKLSRFAAILSVPLVGIVAAFGIAPQTSPPDIPARSIVEKLVLPELPPAQDSAMQFWRQERIQRGDTVASLLARLHVNDKETVNFLRNSKNAKSLHQLIPGKTVQVEASEDGQLFFLRYLNSKGIELVVKRESDGLKALEQPAQLEQRILMKSGVITSSLFAATDAAQLPDNIAIQIADIFATDIDFHKDLRKGDRFTVVYEMIYSSGELVKTGRVVAAEFVNQGKSYRAVYFQAAESSGGYYTPEGKNLRKAFLRSPLEFSRITSGFTRSRYHPILKQWRAHKGIDYAAPQGTRIKATGDATVAFAGRQEGYGNLVILQHQNRITTYYGHLSGFAKGLRKGSKVRQRDVIGYVGMTGLATGPHLHYEFRVSGEQRNPLRIAMPAAVPISPQQQAAFAEVAAPLRARLELLKNTNLARLD